jgi:fructose-1-phosphate kinase PfkB-like protein
VPLLVTGSIGIDTIRTPHGSSENCIGGSAIYFTMAASFFAPVRFIGVVPPAFADSRFVFLANTAPRLQIQLLSRIEAPVFVAADTMDIWITDHLTDLQELLTKVNCLIINADEAKLLARQFNLVRAAEQILTMGPPIVIVKKGESGSLMCLADGSRFVLPAYPALDVRDPTGAGDSFAGGLMGYLAQVNRTDFDTLKTAVAYGTVVASFTIADFSLSGLTSVTREDIDIRLAMLRRFTCF